MGAHRVAYVEANGLSLSDITGLVVRHRCDNPACVNPEHLHTGTQGENVRDMDERGRRVVGHVDRALSDEEAQYVRDTYRAHSRASGARALARELGVSKNTVLKAVHQTGTY